jgi:2-polyprenyl-3-methyl-5-hydroxy-6-metoxy-1,4-benzoquinol methylase
MDYKKIYNKDYFSGKTSFFYKFGYGRFTGFYFDEIFKPLKKYISSASAKKVLDVGCAYGFMLQRFPDTFEKFGLDVSEYAIEIAKKHLPGASLQIWNVEDPFPFKKNFFDLITCNDILEHLEKPEKALENIFKVLGPKGIFYINSPNLNFVRKTIFAYADRKEHHISLMTHKNLEKTLVAAGFSIVDHWTFSNIPFYIRSGSNLGTESAFIVTKNQ